MHNLPSNQSSELPEKFTDPFRYVPHPLVVEAASELIRHIDSVPELRSAFSEGKMLGILIVEIPDQVRNPHSKGMLGYIAAFSGSVGGRSVIEGFVPPIFDLLDPDGYFKKEEARISAVSQDITADESSPELLTLRSELAEAERSRDEELAAMRDRMAVSKRERDRIRSKVSDPSVLSALTRDSQFEKAELRRRKDFWKKIIEGLTDRINDKEGLIRLLKNYRSKMSDELQEWIFSRYIVHNSLGEESSIRDIFAAEGLVPPGGTGDCAAPKLLEYAFRNGLEPVAMGEFWYGKSPETAVRTHGHFYPSCTSKCGPLLGWMLRGMDISDEAWNDGRPPDTAEAGRHELEIIFEDEALIAVSKPSGMPSVPGLDGRASAFEQLNMKLYTVHRLDMDTSGILLFAKSPEAAVGIQKQFEDHTVRKVYKARLSAAPEGSALVVGEKGRIELPLSPDYDERPRQKVDLAQGKTAITDYEVTGINDDGTVDVLFYPITGRTHQLRVHAAHCLGLRRPIVGDLLYGGSSTAVSPCHNHERLCLHASEITFRHPLTGHALTITTSP